MRILGFDHIGIAAKDPKALTDWYVKYLGFTFLEAGPSGNFFRCLRKPDGSISLLFRKILRKLSLFSKPQGSARMLRLTGVRMVTAHSSLPIRKETWYTLQNGLMTEGWYTIDGHRLPCRPTAKGLYCRRTAAGGFEKIVRK